jgi:ubiquinone/menaquinone biosynthesis C-methylase UbiE
MGFIEFFSEAAGILRNSIVLWSDSVSEANKASYNSWYRVNAYASVVGLQKPEKTILDLLKKKPALNRLLDVGVGAGRTTEYFAGVTKEYIGIDYSENMIRFCRAKFKNHPGISFAVADARNLSIYEDKYFDFVLFSYGGLDSVEHKDRIRILNEIWRVTKKDGQFCFSSSNLNSMFQFCRIKLSKNPRVFGRNLIRLLVIRLLNPEMWKIVRGKQRNVDHTMFIVGADNWGLKTYCITPEAKIRQLRDIGFENIRIYDLQGKEIINLKKTVDSWYYYLCNVRPIKDSS